MFTPRFHKGPPPTLQILFEGRLVAELYKNDEKSYGFRYLPDFKALNLAPLPGLPYSEELRKSEKLWPFFSERIPDVRRPEIKVWMKLKNLGEADDLRMLAELGAHSITDPYEIRSAA